jgi:hypothetical protein
MPVAPSDSRTSRPVADSSAISSFQILKFSSVFGSNVVAMATSEGPMGESLHLSSPIRLRPYRDQRAGNGSNHLVGPNFHRTRLTSYQARNVLLESYPAALRGAH